MTRLACNQLECTPKAQGKEKWGTTSSQHFVQLMSLSQTIHPVYADSTILSELTTVCMGQKKKHIHSRSCARPVAGISDHDPRVCCIPRISWTGVYSMRDICAEGKTPQSNLKCLDLSILTAGFKLCDIANR